MESLLERTIRTPFAIGVEEIRKIGALLEERVAPGELRIRCADDMTRAFESVAALAKFENDSRRAVNGLYLSAATGYTEKLRIDASLSFTNEIGIRLRGPEDSITKLCQDLTPIIDGLQPWYSWLADSRSRTAARAICFGVTPMALSLWSHAIKEGLPMRSPLIDILVLTALLNVLTWWILPRLFPSGTFLIGQGANRHELKETARKALCITAPIGIALRVFFTRN